MSDHPEKAPEVRLAGFNLRKSLSREETSLGQWYQAAWAVTDDDRTVLVRRVGTAEMEYFICPISQFLRFHPQNDPSVVWTEIPP